MLENTSHSDISDDYEDIENDDDGKVFSGHEINNDCSDEESHQDRGTALTTLFGHKSESKISNKRQKLL